MKSKVAGAEFKKKIAALQLKLKKVKAEKLVVVEVCQENTEVFENVEKALKLEIENGKNLLRKLKENIECPVCLDIPRSGPVFACPNGHFVCKKCKAGSCATCRVEMGNGKSLLAVTVIENIEHKCKFVECEELFPMEKLDDHEKICQHRTVKCPNILCKVEVALSKLLEHLLVKTSCCDNQELIVIDQSSKTGKVNFSTAKESLEGNKEASWNVDAFSYRNTIFAICASKAGDYYHFAMVMFESEEVCSKFKIEMEVYERDSSYQDSEHSIKFRGNPCSIDKQKDQVKFHGLSVHQEVMKKMTKKIINLAFTLSFSFSEKRAREPEGFGVI